MDDAAAARLSLATLKKLKINTVYPAHGRSFAVELLMKNISAA